MNRSTQILMDYFQELYREKRLEGSASNLDITLEVLKDVKKIQEIQHKTKGRPKR